MNTEHRHRNVCCVVVLCRGNVRFLSLFIVL